MLPILEAFFFVIFFITPKKSLNCAINLNYLYVNNQETYN